MEQETAASVLAGLMFFAAIYYAWYIPYRDKKVGIDQPHLFARIKRDILNLFSRK